MPAAPGTSAPSKPALKKSNDVSKKKTPTAVAFDADTDLQSFNTKKAQLIKQTTDRADEETVLKQLFVTQDEDALDEFEQQK